MPTLSFVGTNLLQGSVVNYYVSSDQDAYMLAKFCMQDDILTNWKHGDIPPHNNFDFFGFRNPFVLVLCRIGSKYNRRRGRLFIKKGRMMRT
jgi:hypothetical protein